MVWSKNKKTGVCRGIPIFLNFAHNIDCGYTLEPPHHRLGVHMVHIITGAVIMCTHNLCFGAKLRKIGIHLHIPVSLHVYKSGV